LSNTFSSINRVPVSISNRAVKKGDSKNGPACGKAAAGTEWVNPRKLFLVSLSQQAEGIFHLVIGAVNARNLAIGTFVSG
jgi:hypothetical protein